MVSIASLSVQRPTPVHSGKQRTTGVDFTAVVARTVGAHAKSGMWKTRFFKGL